MTANGTMNPNRTARIAGALYLIPWIFSLWDFFVREGLIVAGDAAATARNIVASRSLFSLSIVMDLIVSAVFVVVSADASGCC